MPQVINATNSCNDLKKCIDYLDKAYEDSTKAKTAISNEAIKGEEFSLAKSWINENISVEIKNLVDEINYLGKDLVNQVNNYNSNLKDDEGNPLPFTKLSWDNKSSISFVPAGTPSSSTPGDTSTSEQTKIGDSEVNKDDKKTPPTTPTNKGKKYNYSTLKDDELDDIVDSVISSNIGDNCLKNTTIKYNNNYYLWSDISNKIIENLNLSKKVKNISFIDKFFVLEMSDGNSYKANDVKKYNDLILLLKKI